MNMTFEQIKADISARKFQSVYLFMGEESYYIDELTDLLLDSVIPEDEKDFNQHILYGIETDPPAIISLSRSFPMMSDKQLVVIKEAQGMKKLEELEIYLKKPLSSTILVLNYKNGTLDKRKKIYTAADKHGVIFESKKIPEYKIPAFVNSFFSGKGFTIDQKSAQMLTDFLGNDLSKLVNEMDKLMLSLSKNEKRITADLIEKNVGISKDFNNYELLKAIVEKNIFKANLIADFFQKNPKNNPLIVTLVVLFNFFSNLMICYWAKDKSENGIANELGFRNSYQARDYVAAIRNYNAFKTMEIISLIRIYDAKCKGVGNVSTSEGELLKELLYKILH